MQISCAIKINSDQTLNGLLIVNFVRGFSKLSICSWPHNPEEFLVFAGFLRDFWAILCDLHSSLALPADAHFDLLNSSWMSSVKGFEHYFETGMFG